jgi:hypothetical protein
MSLRASTRLDSAIAAAASYLADMRSPDLLWRDFATLAGESCDWVSGFVAHAAGTSGLLGPLVRECTRALLMRQRRSGGWSYNEHVPPDCDSTAWVLLAMGTTTVWKPSMVLRALAYILRHAANGGFATYADEDKIEAYIGAMPDQTEGWRNVHLCVTAAATHALLLHGLSDDPRLRSATAMLREAQDENGLWTSYWWRGFAYATAQSLRALAAAGELTPDLWNRTAEGLAKLQNEDGGFGDDGGESHAFATAMSLSALFTRPDPSIDCVIDAAVQFLLESQQGGRWPTTPILRIPRPMVVAPESEPLKEDAFGTGVIIRDQHGIFTTAAVLAVLASYRAAISVRS